MSAKNVRDAGVLVV